MELKVFKDTIASYGGRWETRLELPVETELLIPDYLPAVFKIVKCLITPVVLQNRVTGNRWQTEGYLRCTVYYQSEEPGARLLRTEQKFAFEKSVELPAGQYAEGPAQVWGEPEYCNCRAVSEHRIDLRGAYILCAAALLALELGILAVKYLFLSVFSGDGWSSPLLLVYSVFLLLLYFAWVALFAALLALLIYPILKKLRI